MGSTLLIINDGMKSEIKRIREYADQRENWYEPSEGQAPPGDKPEYTGTSGSIRFVFSITYTKDRTYRHLSISNVTKYPHPSVVFTMAHLFGFTGAEVSEHDVVEKPADDWYVDHSSDPKYIVVAQKLP